MGCLAGVDELGSGADGVRMGQGQVQDHRRAGLQGVPLQGVFGRLRAGPRLPVLLPFGVRTREKQLVPFLVAGFVWCYLVNVRA